MNTPCLQIAKKVGSLFNCSEFKDFIQIATPFTYPDGDIIDIFYKSKDNEFILTDLGETMRWLESQSISGHKNDKQTELIKNICVGHNLILKRDMFISKYTSNEEIAEKIIDLAQAIIEISSLWSLQQKRKSKNIIDTVEDFIKEIKIPYEREQSYIGSSERKWKPHFYTTYRGNNILTHVLSTDNKSSTKPILCTVNTQWEDLEKFKTDSNYNFISLIIDTEENQEIWSAGDRKLLAKKSEVKRWSNKENFKRSLLKVS